MATSGTFDFNATAIQIISAALRKLEVLGQGTLPTPAQIQEAMFALNGLVKNWEGENILLWKRDWFIQPIQASNLVLGTDGSDYKCIRNHTAALVNRPISGNEFAGFWERQSTSSAPAWVLGTDYVSANHYFLSQNIIGIVMLFVRKNISSSNKFTDNLIEQVSKEDYFGFTDKTTLGVPTQYWLFRQPIPELFIYPFPNSTTDFVLNICAIKFPDDFDNTTDNPDYLQEWIEPLVDGLAVRLAPEYGIGGNKYAILLAKSEQSKAAAKGLEEEFGDIQFSPNFTRS